MPMTQTPAPKAKRTPSVTGMTISPPRSPEPTAADLTLVDVERLASFLNSRVGAVQKAHRLGSDAWGTALALTFVLTDRVNGARAAFDNTVEVPPAARQRQWNQLVRLASAWNRHPEYDAARWVHVWHADADEAARSAAYRRSLL